MPDLWQYSPLLSGSEVLSFETGVSTTGDSDYRTSQRPARQMLDYRYSFDADQAARAEARFRSAPLDDWLVPVWFERTLVYTAVGAADTVVSVDTNADYRDGGQAVAILSDDEFAILEIETVGAGVLNLSAPVGVALAGTDRNPVAVAPLRTAFFADGLRPERVLVDYTTMSATFHVRDGIDLATSPYDQHDGIDVLTDPSVIVAPLSGSFVQAAHFIDNGSGPVAIEPTRSVLDARYSIAFIDAGPAARWARKRWLHSQRGRDGMFWLPSWSDDLRLAAPIMAADTAITVVPLFDSLADYVGRHILIDDGAGYLYREITAAILSGSDHRIFITPTGRDISAATLSFLNRVRLDADQLTLEQSGIETRLSASVKEVAA